MWSRFTARAKAAVFFAQEAAARRGTVEVGPEHLLLGLVLEPSAATVVMLQPLGIAPEALQERIESALPTGKAETEEQLECRLSEAGKSVIDRAYTFARHLGDPYIGTEHLLVGIANREDGTFASRLLGDVGLDVDRAWELVRHSDDQRGRQARQEFDGGWRLDRRGFWERLFGR